MASSLINIQKAAELLGVNAQTLREWEKLGKLKPIRTLGGHRRYKIDEIQKLFENNG